MVVGDLTIGPADHERGALAEQKIVALTAHRVGTFEADTRLEDRARGGLAFHRATFFEQA